MSKLVDIASSELGVTEIPGAEHNQRILEYAQEAGFSWYKSDEVSWCSVFLNWAAHKIGADRSKDARAHSWTTIGKKVDSPLPGDIVLLSSNGTRVYHVGIFNGLSGNGRSVFVLGGNQSNKVSIAPFPLSHVFAYRRIDPSLEGRSDSPEQDSETPSRVHKEEQKPPNRIRSQSQSGQMRDSSLKSRSEKAKLSGLSLPNVKIKYGQRGSYVKQLQEVLVALGFLKGKVDGIYGSRTARAVQTAQFKGRMRPSGSYNRKTKEYLQLLLLRA